MSWSYRSDRSDEIYAGPGPTQVAGSKIADTPGSQGLGNKQYPVDGAIDTRTHTAVLTKGSAGAYTLAAPPTDGIVINITSGTAFAHVVTFTGTLLAAGVALKITWTAPAFAGASLIIQSFGGKWNVLSQNAGALA